MTRDAAYRGIGTFARHLIEGLAGRDDLELAVLVPAGEPVAAAVAVRRTLRLAPGRWARAEHDLLLPLDLWRCRADVVLSPGQFPPRASRRPVVQTLHDVAPLRDPQASPDETRSWRRSLPRWQHAEYVVAISEATAADARTYLHIPPARLRVAHHGLDRSFRPADPGTPAGGPPYLLMVAEYDPRKRHELAFEVIARVAEQHPHVLRVAGRVADHHRASIEGLVARAPRPDRIEILGYVPKAELVALYQGAAAVVVTSSNEGFGFPALEAMACGTPVVGFDNSATAEVVGAAGLLVPDGDVAAMTDAVVGLLADPRRGRELHERGVRRAAEFDWERTVDVYADLLRVAAGRGGAQRRNGG